MFALKVCACGDAVNHARGSLPSREEIDSAAELFKICADPTRVGILCALCSHRLCVCEIASVLDMTSSAISHQLRLMKQMGIISAHREGKSMYYSIADRHIEEMFSLALGCAKERVYES
ncbi:MAG: helix-turn-helix transcriptional regulator [Oscillospiraceae bacterium]|nr:helix-turn-helix transcriptional regulator [Oscillospiraceae bacterium]